MSKTVLFVEYHAGVGGGQVVLLNLMRSLSPKLFRPVLLCNGEGALTESARKLGIETWVMDMGKARWRWFFSAFNVMRAMRQIIREVKPALIHVNCYPANKLVAVAARLEGIPCIWHKHMMGRRPGSTTAFLWNSFSRLNRAVIAVSERVRLSLLAQGMPESKLVRIYNGVDFGKLKKFKPATAARLKQLGLGHAPFILAVGMWRAIKGMDLLVQAYEQAAPRLKGIKLVLVGDSDPVEIEQAVVIRAAALRLKGKLLLIPSQPDLPSLYKRAKLLVSPSRQEVGAPLVAIEAMALGLPVLATHEGSGELIQDAVNGRLVAAGDVQALADAMVAMLRSPALRVKLAARAKKNLELRFGLKTFARQVEALYQDVLAGRNLVAHF